MVAFRAEARMLDVSTGVAAAPSALAAGALGVALGLASAAGFGAAGVGAGAPAPLPLAAAKMSATFIAPGLAAGLPAAGFAAGFGLSVEASAGPLPDPAAPPRAAAKISVTLIDPGGLAVAGGSAGAGAEPVASAGAEAGLGVTFPTELGPGAASPPRQEARMSSIDIFFLSVIPRTHFVVGIENVSVLAVQASPDDESMRTIDSCRATGLRPAYPSGHFLVTFFTNC